MKSETIRREKKKPCVEFLNKYTILRASAWLNCQNCNKTLKNHDDDESHAARLEKRNDGRVMEYSGQKFNSALEILGPRGRREQLRGNC